MIGKTLGHYRVGEQLGRGGMGEVYVADDLSLDRKVALKFLPEAFTGEPERMARFEREAKLLASLNHPNIAAIYGLEQAEDKRFIVMELVEGETLAQKLGKGALPVDDALGLCKQIAEGLEAAHEKGVIHRDLKPANVMITEGDKVKILDFGLAKVLSDETQSVDSSHSPTLTEAMTRPGIILGTAAYMAPEQAKGKAADKRADIWAFGCILYECLTGKRAFEGETVTETLAAILKSEPEWNQLGPNLHLRIRFLLERCLEKETSNRYDSIHDARVEIEKCVSDPSGVLARTPAVTGAQSKLRLILPWVAIAIVAAAIITAAVTVWKLKTPELSFARLSVMAPEGTVIATEYTSAAISPDGRYLVFSATDSAGSTRLWIRSLDSLTAQPLSGTEDATFPFWSPDSRFIGFFADRKLRKIRVPGGQPETICDAPNGRGGTWSRDDVIVFAPLATGPLLRVSANGGEAVMVASPDPARHETALRFPCFLPDNRHFLYVSLPRRKEGFEVRVGTLDSRENARVMSADSAAVFGEPGYLLFGRGGRLMAQRFDPSRLKLSGETASLGNVPPLSRSEGGPLLNPPAGGMLAQIAAKLPNTQLIWLDRSGRPSDTVPLPPGRYEFPSPSPDGRLAAVTKLTNASVYDLWVVDLQRGVPSRLTFDGSAVSDGASLLWSPDGSRLVFQCNPTGPYDIYQVLVGGTSRPEPLYRSSVVLKYPAALSPDGKFLVFTQDDESTGWDLWLLPLEGERKPIPYLRTPFQEFGSAISPDGRWLAYSSDETGTAEIYVSSFPDPREKHRITISGGTEAQWSQDGREMLIYTGGFTATVIGAILSVEVETVPTFKVSTPRILFTAQPDIAGLRATRDLQRFLAAVPVEKAAPPSITVILNWEAGLK